MRLSITVTGDSARPATDLGFLLMKHPDRLHVFKQTFGDAFVYFPVAREDRCTATVHLEIDPVTITKRTGSNRAITLYDYVNDRGYVPSSMVCTAITDAFKSALKGECKPRPDLINAEFPFEVTLDYLRCFKDEDFIRRMFEPLGYTVTILDRPILDEQYLDWGLSKHFKVKLEKTCILRDLLKQLCVLVPVIDNDKHYEVQHEEIARLFKLGDGWLDDHPAAEPITHRYMCYEFPLNRKAVAELKKRKEARSVAASVAEAVVQEEAAQSELEAFGETELEEVGDETLAAEAGADEAETAAVQADGQAEPVAQEAVVAAEAPKPKLHQRRFDAVLDELKRIGARSVLDLGCGEGKLLRQLEKDENIETVLGVEVAQEQLQRARRKFWPKKRKDADGNTVVVPNKVQVVQGSLVYRDDRLQGFDAAVAVEVIEHMELPNLARFAAAIFGHARPGFVVLTTPNREYNVRYNMGDKLRHNNHRFEWTRSQFELWCNNLAMRYGYTTRFAGIGDGDEEVGHTSQMCTFERTTEQAPQAIGKASLYEPPLLDLGRLLGKRDFETSLVKHMFIKNGHAECAVEQLSRFAVDPRWLVYLPPTMSPPDTGPDSGWQQGVLEHPEQVFKYFRERGIKTLVAEEKHMGSRAIVIVCRNEAAAEKHFGVADGRLGACYTRNGNAFFHDADTECEFIARMHRSLSASRFWNHHETNWVMLDCEIMPWSAKARGLLVKQYAPVAAAGRASLQAAIQDLELAKARGLDVDAAIARHHERLQCINLYQDAYRRYCWPVASLDDYKVAPFHILATEGHVHTDKNHLWHMNRIARVAPYSDGLIIATPHRTVDLEDRASCEAATSWWTELTEAGGEGLVFKPFNFVSYDMQGQAVQPAVKCRGREYLRIIYGPEYTIEANLDRFRKRSVGRKRQLAGNEFALGVEALERFVRGEPLENVHECVFGLVAMESEPLDPRL